MSHDWPITIPNHGDTADLLRRKPFFKSEVETNTLGSPPLLNVLRHIRPEHWFAAHLHVKFAAVYDHAVDTSAGPSLQTSHTSVTSANHLNGGIHGPTGNPDEIAIDEEDAVAGPSGNPDEITIDDEDEDLEDHLHQHQLHETALAAQEPNGNPDEIDIEDDFDDPAPIEQEVPAPIVEALEVDESVDLVEAARDVAGPDAANGVIGSSAPARVNVNGDPGPSTQARRLSGTAQAPGQADLETKAVHLSTKFLALDKPGKGRDFLQVSTPGCVRPRAETFQFLNIPTPETFSPSSTPRMTFEPYWLAITRALHPYLSTELRQGPLPYPDEMDRMIQVELERIEQQGLLVPNQSGPEGEAGGLVWEKGPVDVSRVQKFSPTAPAQGQPGGNPSEWIISSPIPSGLTSVGRSIGQSRGPS